MPTKPTQVMGRRIAAFLIDLIISYAFGTLLFFAMAKRTDFKTTGNGIRIDLSDTHYSVTGGREALYLLIWFLFSFGLHVVLQGIKGYTPGKALLGVRTVDAGGNPPGIGKAIVRWLFWIVDAFFFWLVGLITALVSENNQRVGDMVAKTYVVGKEWMGRPLPLGAYAPAPAPVGAYPPGPPPAAGLPPGPPPGIGAAGPNPDWYPDPSGQARLRYWDGQQWTDNTS